MAFFGFLALLVAVGLALRYAMTNPPAVVANTLRNAAPFALFAIGGLLTLMGRGALGIPAILGGMALWRNRPARTASAGSGTSQVRTDWFEMELSHDTGAMNGVVLQGTHSGAVLDDLTIEELRTVTQELVRSRDEESVQLLEAYLDRRTPGWRDGEDGRDSAGLGAAQGSGAMSEQEAYEILGLAPGAGEAEIREAHRRLMKGAHPDAGGSSELAARLNEAKDVLLRAHR